jgi:hypothetical protein
MGVLTDINGMGAELAVLGSSSHRLTDINSRSVLNSIMFKINRGNIGTLVDIDNNTGTKSSSQTIRFILSAGGATNIILNLTRGSLMKKLTNTVYTEI